MFLHDGKSWHKSRHNDFMVIRHTRLLALLYEFFDIDEKKVIKEKELLVSSIQHSN